MNVLLAINDNLYAIVGYTVIVFFWITFGVSMYGLLRPGKIEKRYMNKLFYAVIIEVATSFFFIFQSGPGEAVAEGGSAAVNLSGYAPVMLLNGAGEPIDSFIVQGVDSSKQLNLLATDHFKQQRLGWAVEGTRLMVQTQQGKVPLGYVPIEAVSDQLSGETPPLEGKEVLYYGLLRGELTKLVGTKIEKDLYIAASYLKAILGREDKPTERKNKALAAKAMVNLLNTLQTREDFDLTISMAERFIEEPYRYYDLAETHLAYANFLKRTDKAAGAVQLAKALEQYEVFLAHEAIVGLSGTDGVVSGAESEKERLRRRVLRAQRDASVKRVAELRKVVKP